MEKKYVFLERLVLWGGILSVCILGLCLELIFPIKFFKSVIIICFIIFIIATYVVLLRYVINIGFYRSIISPLIYKKNLYYNDVIKAFENHFENIYYFDEYTSYIIAKKHHLKILITIMKFNNFNKDIYKNKKNAAAKFINKKHKIKQSSTLATSYNKIRINFIVVNEFNEYCKELVFCNANTSFSRIECILNVVLSEKEGKIYIPAHFGLDKFNEYYKTLKLLKMILQI